MELWVNSSRTWLGEGKQFIGLDIQMLGQAEAPLLAFEGIVSHLLKDKALDENGALLLTQCYALSTYWIFGFYEVLRKMRSVRKDCAALSELYHDVSVIRMPLAKHEVKSAPGFREVWHYPTNIFEPTKGDIGWRVFDPQRADFTELYRKELADRFLAAKVTAASG